MRIFMFYKHSNHCDMPQRTLMKCLLESNGLSGLRWCTQSGEWQSPVAQCRPLAKWQSAQEAKATSRATKVGVWWNLIIIHHLHLIKLYLTVIKPNETLFRDVLSTLTNTNPRGLPASQADVEAEAYAIDTRVKHVQTFLNPQLPIAEIYWDGWNWLNIECWLWSPVAGSLPIATLTDPWKPWYCENSLGNLGDTFVLAK
jgi:hypothetical protein